MAGEDFGTAIGAANAATGEGLDLGRGVHDGALVPEAVVRLPLSMVNATG